jgi:general secretion pathway protein H
MAARRLAEGPRGPGGRRLAPGRPPPRAFTLIEMMLVLVLIAILTSVVTISTRPDPHRSLVLQAQRVGLLMGIASDEARMRQEPIVWEADLHSYRFVEESANDRTTFSGDDMLRERSWDPPLTRLTVIDLASGSTRTLVNTEAPPLRVPAAHEWVQPRWRLELGNELATVAVEFDANGHAGLVQ